MIHLWESILSTEICNFCKASKVTFEKQIGTEILHVCKKCINTPEADLLVQKKYKR